MHVTPSYVTYVCMYNTSNIRDILLPKVIYDRKVPVRRMQHTWTKSIACGFNQNRQVLSNWSPNICAFNLLISPLVTQKLFHFTILLHDYTLCCVLGGVGWRPAVRITKTPTEWVPSRHYNVTNYSDELLYFQLGNQHLFSGNNVIICKQFWLLCFVLVCKNSFDSERSFYRVIGGF